MKLETELLSRVDRWAMTVLALVVFTMVTGLASSILLFLGSASSPLIDRIVAAMNVILVITLSIIVVIMWVYFAKFKSKFLDATKPVSPTERFVANTEKKFQDLQQQRAQQLPIEQPSIVTPEDFVQRSNQRYEEIMRARRKPVMQGSMEEKAALIE